MFNYLLGPLNPLPSDIDLPLDHLPSRSSDRLSFLHTVLKVEYLHHVVCEVWREFFPLLHRKVGDLNLALFGESDGSTGDVMGLPEWDLSL